MHVYLFPNTKLAPYAYGLCMEKKLYNYLFSFNFMNSQMNKN